MKTSRRNPALVELVLVILFLAITAAVLAQTFAKARTMSADSRAQTAGLIAAQDIIERWKSDPTDTAALFPADDGWQIQSRENEVYELLCSEDMLSPRENSPEYLLQVELSSEAKPRGTLYGVHVSVSRYQTDGQPLVDCETSLYQPERGT